LEEEIGKGDIYYDGGPEGHLDGAAALYLREHGLAHPDLQKKPWNVKQGQQEKSGDGFLCDGHGVAASIMRRER
jgi:hypothetical protein